MGHLSSSSERRDWVLKGGSDCRHALPVWASGDNTQMRLSAFAAGLLLIYQDKLRTVINIVEIYRSLLRGKNITKNNCGSTQPVHILGDYSKAS